MVDTFTQNQIIRYTYHECSQIENQLIEEIAKVDGSLKEEINLVKEARSYIPMALFSAHPDSLNKVLDYCKF
jgi:hypothetical protein